RGLCAYPIEIVARAPAVNHQARLRPGVDNFSSVAGRVARLFNDIARRPLDRRPDERNRAATRFSFAFQIRRIEDAQVAVKKVFPGGLVCRRKLVGWRITVEKAPPLRMGQAL